MTEVECSRLMEVIANVDYREVNPLVVRSWYEVIGYLDFDLAMEALTSARRDQNIDYLVPRHIIQHADIVKRERERAQRRLANAPDYQPGAPQPKNFEAMVAAYQSGDPIAIAREVAAYEQQLRDAGYSDQWTESGRVDCRRKRFGV